MYWITSTVFAQAPDAYNKASEDTKHWRYGPEKRPNAAKKRKDRTNDGQSRDNKNDKEKPKQIKLQMATASRYSLEHGSYWHGLTIRKI